MRAKPDCKVCKGEGLIQVDDLNTRMCLCAYALAMGGHLGPEIAQAPILDSSPLYVRGDAKGEPPKIDRTTENVFLKGAWNEMLPHLKYVLSLKGLDFRHKITTDEKLKTVYVGDESYKARSRTKRDDIETYNSLADFVNDSHLLIIRLGFLGYKNIAMPGILKESLMHREVLRKPTWLVEDPEKPFVDSHTYSYEVAAYIEGRFKINLDLSGSVPMQPIAEKTWESAPTANVIPRERAYVEPTMSVDDDEVMADVEEMMGRSKPKKASTSQKWKPKKPNMGDDFK